MSDSLNNKELVAVGHHLAKALSSDTPIMDIAKIVSRLAERLDCTTAALREMTKQRDALATENAALKSSLMFWDAEDPEAPYDTPEEIAEACTLDYNDEFIVQVANRLPNRTYRVCESWEHKCKIELVEGGEVKTPATDAFMAEVRAQVWIEAKELAKSAVASDSIDHMGFLFDGKAAQLRQEGAA